MFCSCTWERQEADERASALDGVGKQTEEEEGEELLRLRPSVGRPPPRSQPWERERVRLSLPLSSLANGAPPLQFLLLLLRALSRLSPPLVHSLLRVPPPLPQGLGGRRRRRRRGPGRGPRRGGCQRPGPGYRPRTDGRTRRRAKGGEGRRGKAER